MSQRAENECSFAVDVGVLSFTFNETLLCQSLACIASVLQQLLQTPLGLLIDSHFEIMRTLVALAIMTFLCMLYTVECVQIQLQ